MHSFLDSSSLKVKKLKIRNERKPQAEYCPSKHNNLLNIPSVNFLPQNDGIEGPFCCPEIIITLR